MLCFTFLSWVSAAVLGLLPCSAMLVSLITGQLSLYFTMVQVSALPCTPLHPATSNCQIFWLPGRGSSSPATC